MDKFDTHKFLFSLFHEGKIKGHKLVFIDRENKEKIIEIESIEIGASTVSCKIYDKDNNKYRIPYIRIKEVYYGDDLVWENTDFDMDDMKIIKGYD